MPTLKELKKKVATPEAGGVISPGISQSDISRSQTEALAEINRLMPVVKDLETLGIKTPEAYGAADALLYQIKSKRTWWKALIDQPIKKIREGLEALYMVNRTVDRPMEYAETAVKQAMKLYKIEESRRVQQEEAQRQADLEAIRREQEAIAQKQQAAQTSPMKARLAQKRAELEAQERHVATVAPEVVVVQGATSEARVKVVWYLEDMTAVIKGVAAGKIPSKILTIDTKAMNEYFREFPDKVMEWPGFSVKEDIIIAGTSRR